ncbi:MAG: metal-dependent hydrolase [Pantoea sp.]|uniref:metal-dependent hydrolase n=1 Tax=Pantoea septica TaxID=472695 RepID=UPI001C11F1FA|nr:metal-dependent hydrolase [Pantoea septica]MBU5376806.1 metal-dependent hydrolase [Pantoea septica]MDU5837427.1 metal-dependent hydrolase [Pantoea sp.]MDU6439304.1 metal-dependent hydrolase [Pantoea sp.]
MDSVSQLLLGASVSVAAMGRRAPLWQAAAVGAVCGTLPDLDVFIDHGDAIRNMTLHRTESHALLWLTLASPLLAWLIAGLFRRGVSWQQWWLAIWLALITHPLLDLMTVYGTQLGLPLTDHPFAVGSIYIVDPLYTLPLLICLAVALRRGGASGLRWNRAGLTLSTLYLAWSVAIQGVAGWQIGHLLAQQEVSDEKVLVTPTAFNTLVWRAVIIDGDRYGEAWWSLLSPTRPLQIRWQSRHTALFAPLQGSWYAERVAWFSHGFYALREQDGQTLIADLRMGEEGSYTFTFGLGTPQSPAAHPERLPSARPSLGQSFKKIGERL